MTMLGRGAPAVDRVVRARDVARFIRGQARHDGGDLGCLSEAARGNPLDELVLGRWRIAGTAALDDGGEDAAVDQAGPDAIDADAGAGAFPRRGFRQPDHRVLARAVYRDLRRSQQARDRGGVDDAALVLLEHHRQHVLHAQEHADDVDVEHPAKTLQRIFDDRLDIALDAGVVVEHVDGAEPVDRGADIFGDLVFPGDVGFHRERLRRGRQILDRGFEVFLAAVDRDDAGAALGQEPDGRATDDAGRAGDDGDLAVQPNSIGHIFWFPLLFRLSRILRARRDRAVWQGDYFTCGSA